MIRHNKISAAYKITDTCCLFPQRLGRLHIHRSQRHDAGTEKAPRGRRGADRGSKSYDFSRGYCPVGIDKRRFNVKIKTAERKDKMMKFMTPIRILI